MAYTMLRGGRVLDIAAGTAEPADILVEDDTIREIGPPGCAAPADAVEIAAARRLLHPGLVNAHTHGHGNLAKGMGDRWSLELLLSAAPWITGNRTAEDKYLSTQLGAVEMVMKGCTACYDLSFEWPLPTAEGLALAGKAYADVGMRAVIAPMVADRSFYEAIPGLMEALPRPLQERVAELRLPPAEATLAAIREALRGWSFDRDRVRPAVAPTIPHHCSDAFILGCADLAREFGLGVHSHVAESKVQAVTGIRLYGRTQTAHLDEPRRPRAAFHGGPWRVARRGRHGPPRRSRRLGRAQSGQQHAARQRARRYQGDARTAGQSRDRHRRSELRRQSEHVRGDAAGLLRLQGAGAGLAALADDPRGGAGGNRGQRPRLGLGDRIGRLAPGYKADIVMLDLDHPNWLPFNDPVNQLVHTEDGTAVASVMIGGRLVVDNRRVVTVDLDRLRDRVAAARERLAAANADNRRLYEALEPVVGSYCPGLARTPYHIHRYGARLE